VIESSQSQTCLHALVAELQPLWCVL
jgi:hypothetical protein